MKRVMGWLIVMIVLAACGQQSAAPPVPPSATAQPASVNRPTDTPASTATPLVRATLPPTWTFTPGGILTDTPTPTATNTPMPTDTFTPTPSNTPTVTPNATNAFLRAQPTNAACAEFAINGELTLPTFAAGSAPTLYWFPAEGAAAYRVWLYDTNMVTLLDETTPETDFTFPADLFVFGERYVYEVAPLDADGVQFCASGGGLLLPTVS